jgi:citrate lyase subunit beta-like protein
MRARRAMLYVPGDAPQKILKAATLGADSVILDIEDGVAESSREAAREGVCQALRQVHFGHSEKLVRINSDRSGLGQADLNAVLAAPLDGVVVPKAETVELVRWVGQRLTEAELSRRLAPNSLALILIIETPKAFLWLRDICAADPHIQGLIFGGEDLCAELGATRTTQAAGLLYARSALVMHAAAFNLQAIDMVHTDFKNQITLIAEARQGAEMGFTGKQVIHPSQIEAVQKAFSPSPVEVEQAQRVVALFHEHQARGQGAFAMDGQMVDMPVVRRAENILARAGIKPN